MTHSKNLNVKLELLRFCFEFPKILQGNYDLLGPPRPSRTSYDILGAPRTPSRSLNVKLELLRFCFEFLWILQGN